MGAEPLFFISSILILKNTPTARSQNDPKTPSPVFFLPEVGRGIFLESYAEFSLRSAAMTAPMFSHRGASAVRCRARAAGIFAGFSRAPEPVRDLLRMHEAAAPCTAPSGGRFRVPCV